MTIRLLPPAVVNRIAAGEVVERPSAALKELIENALDAGATEIRVALEAGGKSLLLVEDNGSGISAADLPLAVERHATSKLADEQLVDITTYGFRGEALPAIGAVSRLHLSSGGYAITVAGGNVSAIAPAPPHSGTRVTVRDLFYATPARLKFLKSDASELQACVQVFERQALAHPAVRFSLSHNDRSLRLLPAAAPQDRIKALLGEDFAAASRPLSAARGAISLSGYVCSPTFNKANSAAQYLYVRGRPVNDRALLQAVRAGYADVLAHGRYPALVLFLDIPPEQVDVNVHPAKTEVRFADVAAVKSLVIGAIREALAVGAGVFQSPAIVRAQHSAAVPYRPDYAALPAQQGKLSEHLPASFMPQARQVEQPESVSAQTPENPLGAAIAQIFDTYIIAVAADGMVLTDQHAAHERLVYEQLKAGLHAGGGMPVLNLLIPEVVSLPPLAREALLSNADALARAGVDLEAFGTGAIIVRSLPLAMAKTPVKPLLDDIAASLLEGGSTAIVEEKLLDILANVACRASVKAGQKLSSHEMNALLRQMEQTPAAAQCNHGRPTTVKFSRTELERLFKR